jgi:hypothetical protein
MVFLATTLTIIVVLLTTVYYYSTTSDGAEKPRRLKPKWLIGKLKNWSITTDVGVGLGMHRTRSVPKNPGFGIPGFGHSRVRLFPGSAIPGFGRSRIRPFPGSGHSRYLNAELSYWYTLVHIRHQSELRMTEPELPGIRSFPGNSGSVVPGSDWCLMWTKVYQ